MKNKLLYIALFMSYFVLAQNGQDILRKEVIVTKITQIDTVSINPYYFKIKTLDHKDIDPSLYTIDYAKAEINFTDASFLGQKVIIQYKKFPYFLTKTYKLFDDHLIVTNPLNRTQKLYTVGPQKAKPDTDLFNGIETSGFLSRGITVGNNQDGVVNSGLKLQLKGQLSRKVSINANITDNNVPLQNNGYTQRLNEYDRIFVEMYSNAWKLTAGDLFFNNQKSHYLNFNKKVAGLGVDIHLKSKKSQTNIYTSGAIVKGKFTKVAFNGQESNQGPYRLANNNSQFLLIIANSEQVYINGLPLSKTQYTIDYSSAEITFATTTPINSNQRIYIEFQASEQNYDRFISFNKVNYHTDKLAVDVNFYSESDSKSKSLQQELDDTQKTILYNAGDDRDKMYALSAVQDDYDDTKIQYKKESLLDHDIFVFSNNPTDKLYTVRFTYVGKNQGDYSIENTIATGRIYTYVGVKLGDYEPKIQLEAPNKLQVATIKTTFKTAKTQIKTDLAISHQDNNLFSSIDDNDNQGIAGNLSWNQLLLNNTWQLLSRLNYEHIHRDFNTVERLKNIEFNRDWNVKEQHSNQDLFAASLQYKKDSLNALTYHFEHLNYTDTFNGIKHQLDSDFSLKKTKIYTSASLMSSHSPEELSTFSKLNTNITQQISKYKIGLKTSLEKNLRTDKYTQKSSDLSFKNQNYSSYIQLKDSLRTKLELGYSYQLVDSIANNTFQNSLQSNNYYIKSSLLKHKQNHLNIYANYRQFTNSSFFNDKSLQSKIDYRQILMHHFVDFNTVYETSSGTIPQQEFNYQKVDVGKGYYTWIDYNNDGIQDLDEFEVAQFQDEAIYVRVLLPSTKFSRINRTQLNHAMTLNPAKWSKLSKKIMGHFINQTNISIDNKQAKKTNFQFNPFDKNNALSLLYSFKNFLFFNRGQQHYSITYSYLKSNNKTLFITGLLENHLQSNQLQITHKINTIWLIDLQGLQSKTINTNVQYASRNMDLNSQSLQAKLSYLFNNQSNIETSYTFNHKQNTSENNEQLKAHHFGLTLHYANSKKMAMTTSFNYINNDYTAKNQNSAISYQLLEGLQSGKNYTWSLILQKSLTRYLDFSLNYNGRQSETLKTIHTGTMRLRAKF